MGIKYKENFLYASDKYLFTSTTILDLSAVKNEITQFPSECVCTDR